MNDFGHNKRSNDRFGGRDFKRRRYDRRDSSRMMHKATCANCGNPCEVPFRPSGDRPVYCSECFDKRKGGSTQRSDNRQFENRHLLQTNGDMVTTGRQILDQLKNLNTKLDRIISALIPGASETPKIEPSLEASQIVEKIASRLETVEAKIKKEKTGRKRTSEKK